MIERLSTYFKYGNYFCGIEHTSKDEQNSINIIILKKTKKELVVQSSFEKNSIENSSKKLSKNQHIFLVINNDKVLSKSIESEQANSTKLVYKAFPNINIDDFYFEVLTQKNIHFISVCRKSYVDSLIDKYTNLKLFIINLSFGNNLIETVTNFVNQHEVCSSNSKIELVNSQVIRISKSVEQTKNYNINGIEVSSNYLLPFCGALQTILKNNSVRTNLNIKKDELQHNFKQTRFFNSFLKIGGLFVLVLLLVNFLYFNYYFKKVNELTEISKINESTKKQIVSLNEVVTKKKKMTDDLLKNSSSKTSFYIDRISHSIPNSILLTEFNYQPLLKKIKAENIIELQNYKILVSGTSNESDLFSNWINQLEQKSWISKVEISEYGESSNNNSHFKIKIYLINNE